MGRCRQRYRGCGCGLVERLGHKQPDQLRSVLVRIWQRMAIASGQGLLGSYSMDRFLQRYRDYEYDLVEQLGHMAFSRLMFVLGHILRLMARFFMQMRLGSYLMGQFQQHYHGYEYGLVGRLDHMAFDLLMFILGRI
jgi:hypothetical protein